MFFNDLLLFITKASEKLDEGLCLSILNKPSFQLLGDVDDKVLLFQPIKQLSKVHIILLDSEMFGKDIFNLYRRVLKYASQIFFTILVITLDQKKRRIAEGPHDKLINEFSANNLFYIIGLVYSVKATHPQRIKKCLALKNDWGAKI